MKRIAFATLHTLAIVAFVALVIAGLFGFTYLAFNYTGWLLLLIPIGFVIGIFHDVYSDTDKNGEWRP